MREGPKNKISIPVEWTSEQAEAVCELLELICSAIWEVRERTRLDDRKDDNHAHLTNDNYPF